MKTRFNVTAGSTLAMLLLSGSLVLSGCSGDNDDAQKAAETSQSSQNTMAVKQPEPEATPKATLEPEVVIEKVEEQVKQAEEAVAETVEKAEAMTKEVVEDAQAAVEASTETASAGVNGQQAYSTCIGCHGANGEGGVGPQLNNQAPADIVAKLEKYKAGEQMGPMTGMMAPMAQGLSSEQMEAIAAFIGAK
ncbi:c-type cytochrome [Thiomicrorhabdus sediminis]|nr:cytochrome c [Thiomicrorhabdus sediminis]